MKTALSLSLIAWICSAAAPDAAAQGVDCGETGIDAMGLRLRDDDGNWRYLTPSPNMLEPRGITFTYPDGGQQERWIHRSLAPAALVSLLEPTFGPRRSSTISQCWAILAVFLEDLYPGQFPVVVAAEGDPLPRGLQLRLHDRDGRSEGSLFTIAGNDVAHWEDDLFVLRGDQTAGGAIALVGLDVAEAAELRGISAEAASEFRARGAAATEDLEVHFEDGTIGIEVEIRDHDGNEHQIELTQAADAFVEEVARPGLDSSVEVEADALPPAAGAKIGEGSSITLEVKGWSAADFAPNPRTLDPRPSGYEMDWWWVDVRIVNRYSDRLAIVPLSGEIYLLGPWETQYPLRDTELLGEVGESEIVDFDSQGFSVFSSAIGPGEEGEVRLLFLAPREEMTLRFRDVTPIVLDLQHVIEGGGSYLLD